MEKPQERQETQQSSPQMAAPDGGWGWVVVGSLFVTSALVFGIIRSLGVFFVEFVQYFDESAQAVSWITSIGLAMQQLMSPIAAAACNVYGARPVVMMGGFLSGLGFILASQAKSLLHLYMTMGLISGLGWALVFTPTVASVMQYFTMRRSLAMGLGFTGVGLASFAFSPLFQYLVEVYAWRGALLILGGLSFNMIACGALIRPLGNPKVVEKTENSTNLNRCSFSPSRIYECFELSLLSHRGFLTYAAAITLFNAGYFIPYVHLVAHSRNIDFTEYQAAFVISVTGVADIVGRVASGWASDLGRMRMPHMLVLWTGLLGLFLMLIPAAVSYSGLLVVSVAYGFCAGAMTPLAFAVVPEIVGIERVLGALGLLQLIESVGGLLGAPLSGWLKDYTGTYTASFITAGSFLVLDWLPSSFHICSSSEEYITGIVSSEEDLKLLLESHKRATGTSYTVWSDDSQKKQKVTPRFLWKVEDYSKHIPLSVKRRVIYACQHGKNYKKAPKTDELHTEHEYISKRRFHIQSTKKVDCPAKLYVRYILSVTFLSYER